MEQREVDNMLLSMIQKHFPSLPLSDEHTDWGKWLGFARAVYEAGRASPASVPEDWKLVPVEPTEEMLFKGHMEIDFDRNAQNTLELEHPSQTDDGGTSIRTDMTDAWVAMLAAAPTPPVSEDRWLPIETAPKDEFVLLAGPSGYTTIKTVFATGRMCSDYHVGRWIDHANDDLTDWGFEPTHWRPLPKAPAMQEDTAQ